MTKKVTERKERSSERYKKKGGGCSRQKRKKLSVNLGGWGDGWMTK